MQTLSNYPKVILGKGNNSDKEVWLESPKWECGWYWSFGIVGNKDVFYHLDTISKEQNQNLKTAIENHFKESFVIKNDSDKWKFAELISTFYIVKEYAEVVSRGGSFYTTNPCSEIIKNKDESVRINTIVIPQLFEEIYKVLLKQK